MFHSDPKSWTTARVPRRRFPRFKIECRARIRIGNRQYSGFLHNISQGGAKLRTITPIHKPGNVILRLPDLPPLRCKLRWTDSHNAGVSFELPIARDDLALWAQNRASRVNIAEAEIEIANDAGAE